MVRGLSKAVRAAAKAAHGGEQKEERTWRDETALGPRSFPYHVKEACWAKAEPVKGRDPARWRRDALGNIVFRKLVGCQGCLCHDYDHIVPYSKGGESTLDNCQLLQATANRAKGNHSNLSKTTLVQRSAYCVLSGRDMDLVELAAYGDVVHKEKGNGLGCRIQ
ncbi:unnamed protein product [Sphagnum compactum]|jgi:hypothetical protein